MVWVLWAVLFRLVFLVLALGEEQPAWATGWVIAIDASTTATFSGALLLLGQWTTMADGVAVGAGLGALAMLAVLLARRVSATRHIAAEPARRAQLVEPR